MSVTHVRRVVTGAAAAASVAFAVIVLLAFDEGSPAASHLSNSRWRTVRM
jgi:hypothetical protein